jgi:hypothetical protein
MNTVTKIAFAAAMSLVAFTGAGTSISTAQAQSLEIVEGIGFGATQAAARQNAVRAWIRQSRRDYPGVDANYNTAIKSQISCNEEQQGGGITTFGTGVEGNVDGSWSCSVRGIPAGALD